MGWCGYPEVVRVHHGDSRRPDKVYNNNCQHAIITAECRLQLMSRFVISGEKVDQTQRRKNMDTAAVSTIATSIFATLPANFFALTGVIFCTFADHWGWKEVIIH